MTWLLGCGIPVLLIVIYVAGHCITDGDTFWWCLVAGTGFTV